MPAYVARPARDGSHPGLLVFQEAFGVNHHIRNVGDRFAAEGYVVIAPELFHRTAPPGFEASYTDFPSVMPHLKAVTTETAEADTKSVYRLAAVECAGEAGRDFERGILHGRARFIYREQRGFVARGGFVLRRRDRSRISGSGGEVAGPSLLIWGGLDKHITPEHRKAVTEALSAEQKTYVNVEFSRADHGFFCDERAAYEPHSARQAWALTLEFLRS